MPRFSVIIPLYNKAPYVRKTVESVIVQTYVDWELIIVDDCSTDGGGDVVANITDSRIRLIRLEKNGGVGAARNRGVSESTSPFICFLDADDWWEPTFLEEMARLIAEFPDAGIYGTNYTIINETKHKTRVAQIGVENGFEKGYINYCQVYAKTMNMPLWTGAVCIPRNVFDEMHGFPKGIKLGEDFMLWIHIALKHKVVLLNKPLSNYNQDVNPTYRGTHNKKYDPESFMTFHLNQFAEEESKNDDLKILLDRLRVYSLMNFRRYNLYPQRVNAEIAKVDLSNVERIYLFYYKAPYWIVRAYLETKEILSIIKQKILK